MASSKNQLCFSTLKFSQPIGTQLVNNLGDLGYQTMTPIQAQSLPHILEGKDVIGQGKTGSGKTAAFGLGLLNKLNVKLFRIQSLVLCPTRELADQVATEIRKLGRSIHNIKVLTLCGGVPFGAQIGSLEHGAHIIVGTPGRIVQHLQKQRLDLTHLTTLVLDEADRMLEMGFQDELDTIIADLPSQRQNLLFSATFSPQIKEISEHIMTQPVMEKVDSIHDQQTIKQHFYRVYDDKERLMALNLLLLQHQASSSIVFCNTKRETQQIADELYDQGYSVAALHGDLEQRERDQTLVQFSNKSISVLIATDVASRGLDIDGVDLVINYRLAYDSQVHIHRMGRTGRAGNKGITCTLYHDSDGYKLTQLEDELQQAIVDQALPPASVLQNAPPMPLTATVQIEGGKKQKLRPGDILGALTGEEGIKGEQVGKIQIFDQRAYVAIERNALSHGLKKLQQGKLKGRSFRAWKI